MDDQRLHCFTNGYDTVSAYSVEDAHAFVRSPEGGGVPPEKDAERLAMRGTP